MSICRIFAFFSCGAAYLIRDYNFDGANIHIFDGKQLPGGSSSYGR